MSEVFQIGWSEADLVGGHPALDLVNTAGGATKARDRERLLEFADVLRWAPVAGLISDAEARSLAELAEGHPGRAERARRTLCSFRETLHATLMAVTGENPDGEGARAAVSDAIRFALARAGLEWDGERFAWGARPEEAGLDLVLDRAALATHELFTGPDIGRVRNCERCSWMFVDRSRGRGRRWCSMAACGNRAKARRHYRRTRATSGEGATT